MELFTLLNSDQLNLFEPILRSAGDKARLMFSNVLEIGRFATASEITVRQNERLMKLGRDNITNAFDPSAAVLNNQAIRCATRALKFVNELRDDLRSPSETAGAEFRILSQKIAQERAGPQNEPSPLSGLRDVNRLPDFVNSLADAKEAFLRGVLELNFTNNDDFTEVLEIWDKTMTLAHKDGVAGVLGGMASSLEQFISRRNTEERGTSPASPLAWWKYVVIALYIGSAAFLVFACFYWGGCTWVWPAIAASAPWIFKIIDMGC